MCALESHGLPPPETLRGCQQCAGDHSGPFRQRVVHTGQRARPPAAAGAARGGAGAALSRRLGIVVTLGGKRVRFFPFLECATKENLTF